MNRPTPHERGFVLLIVVFAVVMVTALALVAHQMTTVDVEAAGADAGSEEALYIAEAGIQWALQEIMYTYEIDEVSPSYTALLALPAITGDTDCPDSSCKIFGWKQLHSSSMRVSYGAGYYRVVVNQITGDNSRVLRVRSMGTSALGERRLIEVMVEPEAP